MNIMTKEYKKLISNNNDTKSTLSRPDGSFVTHQELSLVYSEIKEDFQNMDRKFTLEFAKADQRFVKIDQEFVNIRREIHELDEKLTGEIRRTVEIAHKELIEVKNEIMGEVLVIKDYLFTKLTSDIKTVVMECFAEKGV